MPPLPRCAVALAGLLALALAAPPAAAQAPTARVVQAWDEPVKTADGAETVHRYEVSYDYATRTAVQAVYDASGLRLSETLLDGAPQPSYAEIADAEAILRADPEFAALIAETGSAVEGGFLLYDGPCAELRCVQFHIGGGDFTARFVAVDLVTRAVVERDLFPELRD